jgi:outer membrane protein TolC
VTEASESAELPPELAASDLGGPELAEILGLAQSIQEANQRMAIEGPEKVTLKEAMERAENRPQALAADARTASAEGAALAERRATTLPTVGIGFDLTHRDRDYDFETPLGAFTLGERTSTSFALSVTQPLFDPMRRRYSAPAAFETAVARRHQAARLRQAARAQAASAWLTLLALDANLRSTEAFVDSLEARLAEMKARVDAGRVLEADALRIRLDLESAELDRDRLLAQRRVAATDLARAMGTDGGAEPEWDGSFDRIGPSGEPELPDLRAALMTALVGRPDLKALQARLRSLDLEARAIRAEKLPRVQARVSVLASDGDPFNPEELVQGVVSLSWSPFAAGTRGPRAAAAEAEAEAVRAETTEIVRAVALQMGQALADLEVARESVRVRERGVELAEETSRVERERHAAGRSTTNDLLDAEATLRFQRTARALAHLEVMRAWVAYDLAAGG